VCVCWDVVDCIYRVKGGKNENLKKMRGSALTNVGNRIWPETGRGEKK